MYINKTYPYNVYSYIITVRYMYVRLGIPNGEFNPPADEYTTAALLLNRCPLKKKECAMGVADLFYYALF